MTKLPPSPPPPRDLTGGDNANQATDKHNTLSAKQLFKIYILSGLKRMFCHELRIRLCPFIVDSKWTPEELSLHRDRHNLKMLMDEVCESDPKSYKILAKRYHELDQIICENSNL